MNNVKVFLYILAVMFAGVPSQAQVQKMPVVVTWDYYAQPKTLILHALNNSDKDITGYTIIVRHRLPDGTVEQGWSASISDMLSMLITIQMAKDPVAEERTQRENRNGVFTAGTTRDITMYGIDGPDVVVAAGAVFYADGSYDKQDEQAFKQMLGMRQGQLLAIKKANEIIQNALVDSTNDHPAATAITGLAKAAGDSMAHNADGPYDADHFQTANFQSDIQTLKYMQRPQKGMTERERLTQYVEEQERRAELMSPHCHLEIALKADQ
jgi:hypothetical protein